MSWGGSVQNEDINEPQQSTNSSTTGNSTNQTSTNDEEELFVFGYSCKIFRDDEKASFIEKGNHLIPCIGDSTILVDRYDGRGALMDLKSYESSSNTEDYMSLLSKSEAEIEKLCEKERYYDLREEDPFDEAYQEEEYKRLQSAVNDMEMDEDGNTNYKALGYSYDEKKSIFSMGPEQPMLKPEEDRAYTPPFGLIVPPDIPVPETMKGHAIIEKTAKFISSQGNQMEIILKTKQAKNPQFGFLSYSDPLNRYYKFLVEALKLGLYKPPDDDAINEDESDSDSNNSYISDDDNNLGYLHPSLFKKAGSCKHSSKNNNSNPTAYKPVGTHSAYSALVSKIKGVNQSPTHDSDGHLSPSLPNNNNETTEETIDNVPNTQEQLVIEKMATYAVKNGPLFESLAQNKGDLRFRFLDPNHHYHWYYLQSKDRIQREVGAVVASGTFVSYKNNGNTKQNTSSENRPPMEKPTQNQHEYFDTNTIQLKDIPMTALTSASGSLVIPIANLTSIQNRKTNLPAELATRIEEIRKKNHLLKKINCDKQNEQGTTINENLSNAKSILDAGKNQSTISSPITKVSSSGESKLKEERRKKAALFLQKIKNSSDHIINSANNNEIKKHETVTEEISDVESLPSPTKNVSEISRGTINKVECNTTLGKLLSSRLDSRKLKDYRQSKRSHERSPEIVRIRRRRSVTPEEYNKSSTSSSSSSSSQSKSNSSECEEGEITSSRKKKSKRHSKKRRKTTKHSSKKSKKRRH